MTVLAPAKINLGLQIVGKRSDGFHNINTVFHRVGIFDELTFERRTTGLSMSCNRTDLPTNEDNICLRAAAAVVHESGYDGGLHIHLNKVIPLGAGLGGGSSDAAAVLTFLPDFFGTPLSDSALFRLAMKLGSDVPFFLKQGTAYAQGRGEILTYFELTVPYWLVLVWPAVHVDTTWAYRNLVLRPGLPVLNLQQLLLDHVQSAKALVGIIRNDFETVIFRHHEEVMHVKDTMSTMGAEFTLMSGSGSSVFGWFSDGDRAKKCAATFSTPHSVFLLPPEN